jgi:hypothetical protein
MSTLIDMDGGGRFPGFPGLRGRPACRRPFWPPLRRWHLVADGRGKPPPQARTAARASRGRARSRSGDMRAYTGTLRHTVPTADECLNSVTGLPAPLRVLCHLTRGNRQLCHPVGDRRVATVRLAGHQCGDPCLAVGGQLREGEGGRPHGAFVEVRLVAEAERRVPGLELLRALEEADDVTVLGLGGHPCSTADRPLPPWNGSAPRPASRTRGSGYGCTGTSPCTPKPPC